MRVMPGILSQADVGYLPIVAAFVKKIGVAEVILHLRADRWRPGALRGQGSDAVFSGRIVRGE